MKFFLRFKIYELTEEHVRSFIHNSITSWVGVSLNGKLRTAATEHKFKQPYAEQR
jgi:hypothetical protein